jgi:hypothetical protein
MIDESFVLAPLLVATTAAAVRIGLARASTVRRIVPEWGAAQT